MSECVIRDLQRPNGGTAFWCDPHGASATDSAGQRLVQCHHARKLAGADEGPILTFRAAEYPAGIEARCLVQAVFDTTPTDQSILHGIHVHCRKQPGDFLDVHDTFDGLRVELDAGPATRFINADEDAAVQYLVSVNFGLHPKYLECPNCLTPVVDGGMNAVTPRAERTCEACGTNFTDSEKAIANPFAGLRTAIMGPAERPVIPPAKALDVSQDKWSLGIQFWGPEEALIYTSPEVETGGLHTHLYDREFNPMDPDVEDNFTSATVDGVTLDNQMMRLFMAQRAVPELRKALRAIDCPECGDRLFDQGPDARTPRLEHRCAGCGHRFTPKGETEPTISNPFLADLDRLEAGAIRPLPQRFWARAD